MAGQQDRFTDVLCLHQPVAVPPELSNEGRYSVLLFFDTAFVQIGNPEVDGRGGEGGTAGVEGERRGLVVPPGRQQSVIADEEGKGIDRTQQACHDLSKAMASLLTDGNVDVEIGSPEGEAGVAANGNNTGGLASEASDSFNIRNSSRDFHVVNERGKGDKLSEGEAWDESIGEQVRGRGGAYSTGREQQHSPSFSTPSSSPTSPSPPPLTSSRDSDVTDRELSEATLARECRVVDGPHSGNIEDPPLRVQRKHSDGGDSGNEEEEEDRTARSRQPFSPFSGTVVSNGIADYPSGDDSSAEPRADLLLPSPHRDWTSAGRASPIEEDVPFVGGDEQVTKTPGSTHWDSRDGGNNASRDKAPACNPAAMEVRHSDCDEAQDSTVTKVKKENESEDPYEDDFCDDEDESLSPAWIEEGDGGGTRRSADTTTTSSNNHNNKNLFAELDTGSGLIEDGSRGIADSVDDGSDVSVYSGTVAGGLEVSNNNNRANGHDGKYELGWGGSPEGGEGGGYIWAVP